MSLPIGRSLALGWYVSLRTYEEGRGALLGYYTVNLGAWESERGH